MRAADAPAALRALADALDQHAAGEPDPDELQMVRAMRARDASTMITLVGHFMKKWGLE